MWAVYSIQSLPSKHGGIVYRIDFVNIETQQLSLTWIDPTYRNYRYWRKVIEEGNRGLIVSGLVEKSVGDRRVIDADLAPTIEWRGPKDRLADHLSRLWSSP